MKRKTPILLFTALLPFAGAWAQSTTPAPPPPAQQAKPHDPLDDDPLFQSLPPERQEWVRKVMQSINQQLDAKTGTPAPTIPPLPPVKPAQPAPTAAKQTAKPSDSLEDDPAFKRLPPDEQQWIRQTLDKVDTAIAQKDTAALDQVKQDIANHQAAAANAAPLPSPSKAAAPNAQTQPSGCAAPPVKKPKFHIPKVMQDAINKQAKQVGSKTGVDLDPNAPAQAVKDAQKAAPCPPAPVPVQKPANQ